MKYIKLLSIAALALAMAACSGKAEKDGKALAEAEEGVTVVTDDQQAEAVNAAAVVKDVTDDNAWRPGAKVDKLTILDFNATWCGPCRKFAPVLEESAAKYGDKIAVFSVDIDANPTTATAFEVEAVPTIVLIRPDGTTKRYVGIEEIDTYEKWSKIIDENL